MIIETLGRWGSALFLTTLIMGCASDRPLAFLHPGAPAHSRHGDSACEANPRSCIFKGSYESGERHYAELEARRLNQMELARLQRGFVLQTCRTC